MEKDPQEIAARRDQEVKELNRMMQSPMAITAQQETLVDALALGRRDFRENSCAHQIWPREWFQRYYYVPVMRRDGTLRY